jgi:hypothetical protein
MTRWLRLTCVTCAVAIGMLTLAGSAVAQTALSEARNLYAAAAYDDALSILNTLRTADRREDTGIIERYRALCLMALGRTVDANAAIEAAVTAAPFSHPSDTEVSPRVRLAFREVRRRVLPAIIERQYTIARAAFDRKDPTAADRFRQIIALIADADLQSTANQPPLSDLRAMATDFLVLSTPAAPARRAQAPVVTPPPIIPPPPPPAAVVRDAARVYGVEDFSVVPPSAVRQSFAAMADVFSLRPGTVEIIVDETGAVAASTTRVSVNAVYDRLALTTAKSWRYRPAMLAGVAVKYRLVVQLQLAPRH